MEPDIKIPDIKMNQAPTVPGFSPEQYTNSSSPEAGYEDRVERESSPSKLETKAPAVVTAVALPEPVATDSSGQPPALNDVPLIADDDDLIEKEWVERAKKIVSDTKGDPHKRDDQATELKVNYLQKRFGRRIGSDR